MPAAALRGKLPRLTAPASLRRYARGKNMITVWGRTTSSNVMKVLWLLDEMALPYTRIDAGGAFGRTDAPDYLAMNPVGLVPVLEEDDFSLFESNAILRYLANSHVPGTDWYPAGARKRAEVDAWLDMQQTTLGPPAGRVFVGMIRTPPEQRDMAAIATSVVEAGRYWAMVDAKLGDHDFLLGTTPTLADVAFGVHVHRWFAMPIDRPDLPALRAWYDRLLARPPYATNCAQPLA